MNSLIDILACPICGSPFTLQQTTLVCTNAHAFDVAREGYVNLLRKKLPGDAKEMLLARRNFFEEGYYQPISSSINALVKAYLPTTLAPQEEVRASSTIYVLDAGCGEGYYLARLYTDLIEQGLRPLCLGIDVSKEAIRLAARRYGSDDVRFLVANLKEQLVVRDAAIQIMLNVFAPRNVEEYARVLAPGALLLVVIPGQNHLHQLRARFRLLDIEEGKLEHVLEQFARQFALLTRRTLAYTLRLRGAAITWLVMMTPNYWHMADDARAALAQLAEIEVCVEVHCLLFRRRNEQ